MNDFLLVYKKCLVLGPVFLLLVYIPLGVECFSSQRSLSDPIIRQKIPPSVPTPTTTRFFRYDSRYRQTPISSSSNQALYGSLSPLELVLPLHLLEEQDHENIIHSITTDQVPSPPTFLTATVETFDGSTIVDPVVVSNVFWVGLKSKLISWLIGQLLATIVFSVLVGLAASQLSNLATNLAESFSTKKDDNNNYNEGHDLQTSIQRQATLSSGTTSSIEPDFQKLVICVMIDLIGSANELLPVVGELSDIFWAPIAAYSLRSLYGNSNLLFLLEFSEEILPLTDILPLATICWVVEAYFADSTIAEALGLGVYNRTYRQESTRRRQRQLRGKQDDVIDAVSSFSNDDER